MAQADLKFAPGTLLQSVNNQTAHALRRGALQPILTDQQYIEQGGVRFVVRSVSSLTQKDRTRTPQADTAGANGDRSNPFLPFEPDLFVADISQTHLCLLNKFNVMDHHLLVVTRAFEPQETPLTSNDFEALWACMAEIDGLAFYNSGTAAGASQPHKHLQLVPLPIASEGPAIPIEPLVDAARNTGTIGTLSGLPFAHAFMRLEPYLHMRPSAAELLHHRYLDMLDRVALAPAGAGEDPQKPKPYNLLATRTWMLLVPRSREFCDTISINALGFAGSLFVRDAEQMEKIRRLGPMTVLRAVGHAPDEPLSEGGHPASRQN